MEVINLAEITSLLDRHWRFLLVSQRMQRICNDPLGDFIIIKEGEMGELNSYSRNSDGSLCFQVNFEKTSAFYYSESWNTYDWHRYIPEFPTDSTKFEDLFWVKERREPLLPYYLP